MFKNKILNEYLDNEYDKDKIYNSIYSKIKNKSNLKRKLLNSVAIVFGITILTATTSSIYAKKNWEKEYDEYLNRYINCAKSRVNNETINGNVKNLDMDYVYIDEIGIKVNSLVITDYTCQMDISVKSKDENKKSFNAFEFGFAVYDEENNIYQVSERLKYNTGEFLHYEKKLCKELGLKYNASRGIPKKLTSGFALNPISVEDDNTIMRLELKSDEILPKTKKLYIRIFDMGYSLADISYIDEDNNNFKINDSVDFKISDSEWQFEIEIPEQFYNKTYEELKFAEDIEDFKLEEAILSNTNLSIMIDTKYSAHYILEGVKISDEDENIYNIYKMSNNDKIKLIFNVGKNITDKRIYLNIDIPEYNIYKKIELIKR